MHFKEMVKSASNSALILLCELLDNHLNSATCEYYVNVEAALRKWDDLALQIIPSVK